MIFLCCQLIKWVKVSSNATRLINANSFRSLCWCNSTLDLSTSHHKRELVLPTLKILVAPLVSTCATWGIVEWFWPAKLLNTGINTGNIVSSAGRQTNSQAGAVGGGGTNKDDNSWLLLCSALTDGPYSCKLALHCPQTWHPLTYVSSIFQIFDEAHRHLILSCIMLCISSSTEALCVAVWSRDWH